MNFSKRFLTILVNIIFIVTLSACGAKATTDDDTTLDDSAVINDTQTDNTDSSADLTGDMEGDDTSVDSSDMGEMAQRMSLEASADAEYAGTMLYLEEAINTVAPDGAEAGTLVLAVTFENPTDASITLPFAEDDYIIVDAGGIEIIPSTISPELILPEIGAGESITGSIEYAVTDAEGTFTLNVGSYEQMTFSSVSAE